MHSHVLSDSRSQRNHVLLEVFQKTGLKESEAGLCHKLQVTAEENSAHPFFHRAGCVAHITLPEYL